MRTKEPLSLLGFFLALGAFSIWGVAPLYWKLLQSIPPAMILFYRVLWCAFFLAIWLTLKGQWLLHLRTLRKPSMVASLAATSALIGSNWFTFIYAVNSNRILETSLGYFINPLLTVCLAVIFLKEYLPNLQKMAILLSLAALMILTIGLGKAPVISIILALTFGGYGLMRKIRPIDPVFGLMLEAAIVGAALALYLARALDHFSQVFDFSFKVQLLLMGGGILTVTPLLMFGIAVKKLPLSMTGFLQYIAPSGSFLLGVFYFREPFSKAHLSAYCLIWLALAIFTYSRFKTTRIR